MIYKLVISKLSFKSIFRISFLFMASNEDLTLNMKAKKARSFLYFLFLIFYLQYRYHGWDLA